MSMFISRFKWNHTTTPKKYSHKNKKITFDFIFWCMWTSHLELFFLFLNIFHYNFIYLFRKNSNKNLQIWTYEVYCVKINTSQSMKICKYTSKLRFSIIWMLKKCTLYFMHIDFIQLFSSKDWIKLNFDSKWILSSKMLLCTS